MIAGDGVKLGESLFFIEAFAFFLEPYFSFKVLRIAIILQVPQEALATKKWILDP